jgi:hypothetical protein
LHLTLESVEDTIQNGVKRTEVDEHKIISDIKDVIQNGVKEAIDLEMDDEKVVEYFIENSVKLSLSTAVKPLRIEDTIENGVKQTERSYDGSRKQRTKYVIQNGVKYTQHEHKPLQPLVNDAIKHGEKIELK